MTVQKCAGRKYALIAAFLLAAQPLIAANVGGVVRDGSATPLEAMVVAAYNADGTLQATGKTDFLGRYGLDLPAGDYRVLAYDLSGLYATSFDGNADSFNTSPIVSLTANQSRLIDFILVPGGSVSGRVTLQGAPLRDSAVEIYNLSGTQRGFTFTDVNGLYSLVAPPGEYKLIAYHNSGLYSSQFYSGRQTFDTADKVVVTARGTVQNVNFDLQPAASLVGSVDDPAGQPVSGIRIFAFTPEADEAGSTLTNGGGQYTLSLPAGAYRLVATDQQGVYATAYLGNSTSFEKSPLVTVTGGELRSGLSFTVSPGTRLSGRVVDSVTSAALPVITVGAYNLDGTQRVSARTSADGSYSLVLPPGSFKLIAYDESGVYATAFHEGQITFHASTIVAASQDAPLFADFALVRSAHIRGTVFEDGSTRQAPGVLVAAYTLDGIMAGSSEADAAGRYGLVVTPGTYKLLAFDPRLRYATSYLGNALTFEVSPARTLEMGQIAAIDFSVRRGTRVSGNITDPSGAQVSGVEIYALTPDGDRIVTTEGLGGRFDLVVLPGTYIFAAQDPVGRFTTVYYQNARALREASPVTVSSMPNATLHFVVEPVTRRRSARH
ncbi:MAG TPA: carboxypeptidase-like regulatory domain-containing protein [Thermoanaerobaculia bacterium]|nr:carboxypeptidase-like regulatory domain-containing protein [Thermoanaerobaculia bacterium]